MNLPKQISLFFRPRFATAEFEYSDTRGSHDHIIYSMFYDDDKAGYPTWVNGCVIIPEQNKKIQVVWDKQGNAWVAMHRRRKFDLMRTADKENEMALSAYAALLVFMVFIIVTILLP